MTPTQCQATITEDDYVESAPELVAEVSGSSVSLNVHTKFAVYRGNGVREYLIWRVQDTRYVPLEPDAEGVFRSATFPGLWLDVAALVRGDMPRVFAVLQQGISSPEDGKSLNA